MTTPQIELTPDYGLNVDDRQYVVMKRHVLDPTRAPGYKAVEGAVPPPKRVEWRELAYFSLNAGGFVDAIQFVLLRTTGADETTLGGLVAAYNAESQRLRAVIEAAIKTGVSA